MSSSKAARPEPNYISLKDAHAYALKMLRFSAYAEAALKKGLNDGAIQARAKIVLREYACGSIRSFEKRRQKLQIETTQKSEGVIVNIEPQYLRREPKGAQFLCNWRSGHLAWVAPMPARYTINKLSGKPRATLPVRHVMYDVEVDAASVQRIIGKLVGNNIAGETLRTRIKAAYNTHEAWKELLPDFFKAAEKGELDRFYPYKRRGGKAALQRALMARSPSIKSDSTAKRILATLVRLDESANSARIQQKQKEQQLTNS